jgi:hypothetical protein
MSLFYELETVTLITDIGLKSNASLWESCKGFFCSSGIVGVIYCDDKVMMGCQSLGDDQT